MDIDPMLVLAPPLSGCTNSGLDLAFRNLWNSPVALVLGPASDRYPSDDLTLKSSDGCRSVFGTSTTAIWVHCLSNMWKSPLPLVCTSTYQLQPLHSFNGNVLMGKYTYFYCMFMCLYIFLLCVYVCIWLVSQMWFFMVNKIYYYYYQYLFLYHNSASRMKLCLISRYGE